MDYWTRNVFEVPKGTGSGFVWDDQGHVVTNFHVVQDAVAGGARAKVTLGDDEYDATVVGFAHDQDLAVLRIDAPAGEARAPPGRHQPATSRWARRSTPSATPSASTTP